MQSKGAAFLMPISIEMRSIIQSRYFLLSFLVFLYLVGTALAGILSEDFWEHSAVVREFSTHPWNPRHPLFLIDLPHAFFNPYLLSLGLISRATPLDSVQVLLVAGLFNFILIAVGFRLFVNCLFKENRDIVSFYALFFVLFFWPTTGAGMWTGFYHFKGLAYVIMNPASFAMGLTFLTLALFYRALESGRWPTYLGSLILTTTVIITHPATALFTLIGLGAFTMHSFFDGNRLALLGGFGTIVGALAMTGLWPYYSFLSLVLANNPEFHGWSIHLYERLVDRHYSVPVALLFVLPLIIQRLRANIADALVLMLIGTFSLYSLGWLTGIYGVGRVLSQFAIILQVMLGGAVTLIELRIREGLYRMAIPYLLLVALIGFMNVGTYGFRLAPEIGIKRTLSMAADGFSGQRKALSDWYFLRESVPQYEVVLADMLPSWTQTTFGGKSIASIHPVHWVTDTEQRREDVHDFFLPDTPHVRRKDILTRYCARYILLMNDEYVVSLVGDIETSSEELNRFDGNSSFAEYGEQHFRNESFTLVRTHESLVPQNCQPVESISY